MRNRRRASKVASKPKNPDVVDLLGPLAEVLKKNFLLLGATLAGTLATILIPRIFVDAENAPVPETGPWVVAAGIIVAVAVVLDKIADLYEKRASQESLRGSEDTAANAASDLNTFLVEAIEVSFDQGAAMRKGTKTLGRMLTMTAAKSVGPGSRATFYTLTHDDAGLRTLGSPEHTTEYGRYDKPKRPFVEAEDPTHPIWRIMDGPDEEPEVVSAPDEVYGINWSDKKYKTFLSVPVKANDVQFGLLSVNNSTVGSIGESQRAIILSMARTMALVLALQQGPKTMTSLLTSGVPVVSVKIETDRNGAADDI
jgi:GAF domain-containing protein